MKLEEDIEKLQTLISKYKKIEKSNNNDHKLVLTVGYEELKAIDTVLEELDNRIPKEKIEKEFDYFTSHNNNFNIADMELLKDKILDEI